MNTKDITWELYDKVYTEDTPTARSIYKEKYGVEYLYKDAII